MSSGRQGDQALTDFEQLFHPGEPPQEGRLLCASRIESTMRQKSALLDTVISALRQLHLTRDEELRVRLCLDEAITNAIRHGNRHDPNRFVAAELRAQPHRWTITVTDEGTGFTPCDIPDPEDAAALLRETGRGLLLIREFMDEVAFYRDGRCIWMARHTVEAPEDAAPPGATSGLEERCFRLQPGDPHGMILIPCGVPCLDDAACIRGESQVEEICEAAGTQVVVVDLGPVQLLTDASIGLLLNLRRELERRGGVLRLARPSTLVRQILTATRLLPGVFECHDTLEAALTSRDVP